MEPAVLRRFKIYSDPRYFEGNDTIMPLLIEAEAATRALAESFRVVRRMRSYESVTCAAVNCHAALVTLCDELNIYLKLVGEEMDRGQKYTPEARAEREKELKKQATELTRKADVNDTTRNLEFYGIPMPDEDPEVTDPDLAKIRIAVRNFSHDPSITVGKTFAEIDSVFGMECIHLKVLSAIEYFCGAIDQSASMIEEFSQKSYEDPGRSH